MHFTQVYIFLSLFPAIIFAARAPTASPQSTSIPLTAVVRPSPQIQQPPTSITDLLQIIEGSVLGAQFSIIDFQGFNLNVANFQTHDEAPVISQANNATGLNSAFLFHVIAPATPFLVTIQDTISGSFLSYSLAGTGLSSEFAPAVIFSSSSQSPVVFEVTHTAGTAFTLTESSSNTFLTSWPASGNIFSPVTYQAMNTTSFAINQSWTFAPLQ